MSGTKMVAFELSMPGVNSWNGRWTGEERCYAILRRMKANRADALDGKSWHYSFGDGWVAGVSARSVAGPAITKLRRASAGFCGYDWMVNSILACGEIRAEVAP